MRTNKNLFVLFPIRWPTNILFIESIKNTTDTNAARVEMNNGCGCRQTRNKRTDESAVKHTEINTLVHRRLQGQNLSKTNLFFFTYHKNFSKIMF